MPEVTRISVDQAREKVTSGRAMLVCAYEDEEKCRKIALEGAISVTRLQSRSASLPKDQELIFYCA